MSPLHLSPALWLAVDLLATYRLTRLATRDRIAEPIRRRLGGVEQGTMVLRRPKLYEFLTCPWCTSIWIAAGVTLLTWAIPGTWVYPAYLLGLSAAAGWAMERGNGY